MSEPHVTVADPYENLASLAVGRMEWRVRLLMLAHATLMLLGRTPTIEKLVRTQPPEGRRNPVPMWLSGPPPSDVTHADHIVTAGDREMRVRVYRSSAQAEQEPGMLYIHGGGFVTSGIESTDAICAQLASRTRATVVSVDYRLAPETVFPGQLEDVAAGLRWMREHALDLGLDVTRIVVSGDSAGGNLAAGLCLWLPENERAGLVGQLLLYPCLDSQSVAPSMLDAGFWELKGDGMRFFFSCYRGDVAWDGSRWHRTRPDEVDPGALSPLHATSLSGQPPAVIVTGGLDSLRDEGAAYARRLQSDGVPATLRHFPDAIHGFLTLGGMTREADAAFSACADGLLTLFARTT